MTCSELDAALRELADNVYKDAAPPGVYEYVVWAVSGYRTVLGDDGVQMRIPKVQIDLYSQADTADIEGGFFDTLLEGLDELGLVYSVQDVGFDHDAAAMRCIIQLEAV